MSLVQVPQGCQHHSGHETNIAFPPSGVQRSTHPIRAIGSTDAVVHRRVARSR
jgi:hypothetical protein